MHHPGCKYGFEMPQGSEKGQKVIPGQPAQEPAQNCPFSPNLGPKQLGLVSHPLSLGSATAKADQLGQNTKNEWVGKQTNKKEPQHHPRKNNVAKNYIAQRSQLKPRRKTAKDTWQTCQRSPKTAMKTARKSAGDVNNNKKLLSTSAF